MEYETADLLKIGDLSRETGLTVSTIKYYVKEGLIAPALKTGRNMAYYHPDCIGRLRTIKTLQKERYYPLDVIKQILNTSGPYLPELDLLDAIHKVARQEAPGQQTCTRAQLLKKTGLTGHQLDMLIRCQLVMPLEKGARQYFSQEDYQLAVILKRRTDAQIPFEQSVSAFRIYEKAMKTAAQADVNSFIVRGILTGGFTTEELSHMIRVSDETLDDFIALRRMAYNRRFGADRLRQVEEFSEKLAAFAAFLKETKFYSSILPLTEGCKESFAQYDRISCLREQGVAHMISVCGQVHQYFLKLKPADLISHALCAGWFYLGRDLLDCRDAADVLLAEFEQQADDSCSAFAGTVKETLYTLSHQEVSL